MQFYEIIQESGGITAMAFGVPAKCQDLSAGYCQSWTSVPASSRKRDALGKTPGPASNERGVKEDILKMIWR